MTEIHHASKAKPVLWRYEPGFRRVYAQGTLLRHDPNRAPDEPLMLHLSLFSEKEENIPLEEGTTGTGYRLEVEAVMTWETARRLHGLLGDYLERNAPGKGATPEPPA